MVFVEKRLNLPNVTVASCLEQEDLIYLKLTLTNSEAACPPCGKLSQKVNQTRPILVRNLPISGRIVHLEVPRRQFYCSHCQHYFTEPLAFSDPERNYTRRYEESVYQQVKQSSVEQVSRNEQLSPDRVRGIFNHVFGKREAQKKEKGLCSKKLSIDKISKETGCHRYATVLSDVENHDFLELVNSHREDEVIKALKARWSKEEWESVEEVSIDMWSEYAKVVNEVFPDVKIVYDRFHVMKHVNQELNKIWKQVGVTEKGSRWLFLKNRKELTDEEKQQLEIYLRRSKRLRQAYNWKEEFREIYEKKLTVELARKR